MYKKKAVLLLRFASLLFVNPRKWTFLLSGCATLNVLIWSVFTCMCMCERQREQLKETSREILKHRKEGAKTLSHWWMAPFWKLRHANQMVDRHGNRILLMNRMTVSFAFMVHLIQLVDDQTDARSRTSVDVLSLVVLMINKHYSGWSVNIHSNIIPLL